MIKRTRYYGDIGDVRDVHRFDVQRLGSFLKSAIGEDLEPIAVRQFEGGQSNPTYLIEGRGASFVVRRKPPGDLLASAHAVDREFRVLKALHDVSYPVPEPLVLCEDKDVIGSMFYVMRFVKGRIFGDNSMPDLSREERGAVYAAANDTLAQLHRLDLKALGLEDYGRAGNYFERQIARWSRQYRASETETIPAMDRLIEWLPGAAPADEAPRLIHGDYSFHNIMFHPTEPRVLAVLDWELSTTGHPLGDLMYHGMEWYRPINVDKKGSLIDQDLDALGIPTLEDYVARYCVAAGRPAVTDLNFHKAYNLFRVAAIVQGIVGRARDGTAAGASAAEQAKRVRPLAEAAWGYAQQAQR